MHYLFEDERLGGTVFFRSRLSAVDTERLFQHANQLAPNLFERRCGLTAAFMTQSNALFEVIGHVPARWNRAVFYDGGLLHSGDIQNPGHLLTSAGPGRLTLNALFQRQVVDAGRRRASDLRRRSALCWR